MKKKQKTNKKKFCEKAENKTKKTLIKIYTDANCIPKSSLITSMTVILSYITFFSILYWNLHIEARENRIQTHLVLAKEA